MYHSDFLNAGSHLKQKAKNRLPFDFRCGNTQGMCITTKKWGEPNF